MYFVRKTRVNPDDDLIKILKKGKKKMYWTDVRQYIHITGVGSGQCERCKVADRLDGILFYYFFSQNGMRIR